MNWLCPFLNMGAKFGTLWKKKDKKRLVSIEMKFFDHRRNAEIMENLQVEPLDEKLRKYKYNWLRRVTRMNNNNRMSRIMVNYRPNR
jgi:hypothetical protein